MRLALVDRIADLPGIEAVEHSINQLPRQIDIYVHNTIHEQPMRKRRRDLLCSLSAVGIVVPGLDRWTRHQVVLRHWGCPLRDHVMLYMPRDDDELDVCWNIIRQAYDAFFATATKAHGRYSLMARDLPKFSRTTLQ